MLKLASMCYGDVQKAEANVLCTLHSVHQIYMCSCVSDFHIDFHGCWVLQFVCESIESAGESSLAPNGKVIAAGVLYVTQGVRCRMVANVHGCYKRDLEP
jgi:hypothetical protein